MASTDKRSAARVPTQIAIDEIVEGKALRCMTLNLGPTGLYLQRLARPLSPQLSTPDSVLLEFELPGTGEVVSARGEICHEQHDEYFTGSGVRFSAIADVHREMIADYVRAQQRRDLPRWWTYGHSNARSPSPAGVTVGSAAAPTPTAWT